MVMGSAKAVIEVSVDSLSGLSEEADEWEKIKFMVYSGAGTTVIGPEHVRAVQALEVQRAPCRSEHRLRKPSQDLQRRPNDLTC